VKRAFILGTDLIIPVLIVCWFELGWWRDLYGFTGRHPESALRYFQAFICVGSALFGGLFALVSIAISFAQSSDESSLSGSVYRNFYGTSTTLLLKYAALIVVIIVSPTFYYFMWRENISRATRSIGGFFLKAFSFFCSCHLSNGLAKRPAVIRGAKLDFTKLGLLLRDTRLS